jgi:mannose-6-phosphate isomerase-like protein (cupin superfamily)
MNTGEWLHNPVTGELGHLLVSPEETGGVRLEADLWLQPGAAVLGEHTHSALVETFEVVEGTVAYRLDGVDGSAGAGERIEIPLGARHDWWNGGSGRAQVRFKLESSDHANPMAGRFLSAIETAFGLAALGKTNSKGMPSPLWLAAMAHEYRDVMVFTRPPAAVQSALFGPLAALARRLGRDPLASELHGADCPARIPAPDESERDALLRRRVGSAA